MNTNTSDIFSFSEENVEPVYHTMQTPHNKATPSSFALYPPVPMSFKTPFQSRQQFYQPSGYVLMPPTAPSASDTPVSSVPVPVDASTPVDVSSPVISSTSGSALQLSTAIAATQANDSLTNDAAKTTKRGLNFADEGPSSKTARRNSDPVDVPAKCHTVEERVAVELDMLIRQCDLEKCLTLNERTRLHRFLLIYLVKVKTQPCTEYKVSNLTAHAAIQVIHRSTYLERYDGDVEKNLLMVNKRVVSLEIYWFEVRPNFLPKEGLCKKKVSFINPTGSVCFFHSRFFFTSNIGNDLFRLRQVLFTVSNEVRS